ncbi:MAG: transcriptional regulator [Deltaproteobacteria bacterium]|nr:MAG: transcriptional regulator [Deltaproteobacteria bacterium]
MEKKSILFVDDEEVILEIVSEFFEQKEYNVFTCTNGFEALSLFETEKIDCCFTDINMPEMDGLSLAEEIRKKDNTLPVIIMTGYPSVDNILKTLKNGIVDFLIKPINLSQMELCIKRILRERELFIGNILLKKEIENKERLEKLNRELSDKVEDLSRLNKIMSDFTGLSSSEDIFRLLLDMSVDISEAESSALYIINDENLPVNVFVSSGEENFFRNNDISLNLIEEVAKESFPVLIKDAAVDERIPESVTSLLLNPLQIRDKTFAVLAAAVFDKKKFFVEKSLFYISFICQRASYNIENLALYENIYDNLFSTLYAFVTAIEARDDYTGQHSNRVSRLAVILGKALGCSDEEIDALHFGGRLHDIGKIGISDILLLKEGSLTAEEFEEVKKHPVIGADIIGKLGLWSREEEIIRYHHERYDGTGYPEGLKANEIPYLARITSVVDAYDAMASNRVYRKKLSQEDIIRNLEQGAGSQFDPFIVRVFIEIVKEGKHILDE